MSQLPPEGASESAEDATDEVVPSSADGLVPLVGIGGSAGAIPALEAFFQSSPPSTLAYAVVLHLSPDHESSLPDLLRRWTPMPVVCVTGREHVEPGKVYVISPRQTIRTEGNDITAGPLEPVQGRHVAVDLFLRSLAESHGPHAAAVVLSGMDSDGAIGVKRIKERGGLVVAQDPSQAEQDGMPRSAISTGLVDWVLPAAAIPQRLNTYFSLEKALKLPAEDGSNANATPGPHAAPEETLLREVLSFLRMRTGRDFSDYKRATIVRRIARRMQVNGVPTMQAYLDCLRTYPGESTALLQDLLISVTNFFRDPECFAALDNQLGAMFEGKGPNDTVRVWVVACATGEEAYTVAMLLAEKARAMEAPPLVQVFASDLDEEAIRVARDGLYPMAIEADLSQDRLRRFFLKEHNGYRVRREVREMVLFAQHDILKDSPFSRLDLVSCRNLMIYLNRSAQQRLLQIFHFALQPRGVLFLGASESAEDATAFFGVVDKKNRIFVQRPGARTTLPVVGGSSAIALTLRSQMHAADGPVVAGRAFLQQAAVQARNLPQPPARTDSSAELHFRLLESLAPPSVLVDSEYEILHLSPNAGRMLQLTGGEPTRNLLKLVNEGLRVELRAVLYQAAQSHGPAEVQAGPLAIDGDNVEVQMRASPAAYAGAQVFLVTFDARPTATSAAPASTRVQQDRVARQLDHELERLKSHLRDTVEQYEASTEELKASNEELQAMNEELRSATEELETSREELQSINEELTTVNQELKMKVDELAHSNSDMQNLMDATAIATVFLDRDLCVMRYTPSAIALFNLIPSDLGRPLADLATRLDYPQLSQDARAVLERLTPIEREVGLPDGNWFLTRILPYRTGDDRIAGVVLSFIDISERKRAEQVRLWLSTVVAQSSDAIVSFSTDRTILSWNHGAEEIFGWTAEEAIARPWGELMQGPARRDVETILAQLRSSRPLRNFDTALRRKDGSEVHVQLSISPILAPDGRVLGGTAIARDVTVERAAAQAQRLSEERLRLVIENAQDYAIFSMDLQRRVTVWNSGAQRLLGYAESEVVGQTADVIFLPQERASGEPEKEARLALEEGRSGDDRFHVRKDGSRFWASGVCMRMRDASGAVIGLVKILRDQTAAREASEALERSQAELQQALVQAEAARQELEIADQAKDRFLAVLSHELRNPLASIAASAELMVSPDTPKEQLAKAARVVRRQSASMRAQLDDLLDISRLRLGHGIRLHRETISLSAIIDSATEATRPAVEAGTHVIEVTLPQDVEIEGDFVRLSQVIANLVTNAAKYTPAGGRIQVVSQVLPGDRVEVTVVDNGIGMAPDEVERMFGLFVQASSPGVSPGGGLGIGLALARSIVEMHGGTITAESEGLGHGCRARVVLPIHRVLERPAAETGTGPATAQVDALADGHGLVIVADDNEDAAWGLAQLLELHGVRTLTAGGGLAALALAEKHRPDAMLVDLGMPDLNGYEVARRLRSQPWGSDIVLIAATGWGQDSDIRRTREAGFDAHLIKPLDITKVEETIEELVQKRRASRGG